MRTSGKERACICADPENCTTPVPGWRCRRGDAKRAPSAEGRTVCACGLEDPKECVSTERYCDHPLVRSTAAAASGETPRTDAACFKAYREDGMPLSNYVVDGLFACQLERENQELRGKLDALRSQERS